NMATGESSGGGGIWFLSPQSATLTNCTLANNQATSGGGLLINQGSATLLNTIVSGNTSDIGRDGTGEVSATSSFNLIGTGGSGGLVNGVNGNQVGVANPGLAPLANYGGPTQTHALLPGSPAINAGTSTGASAADQRGINRPQQSIVDIGAFESQGFTLAL